MTIDNRGPSTVAVTAETLPSTVSRSNLVQRVLEHGASLILYIAPAGFGKTIAMTQLRGALDSRGMRTAWWSLDRSDNDPQRLFVFLRRVLRSPGETDHIAPFGLNVADSGPLGIFLDDFEVVEGGPLPEIVRNLLGQLPQGSKLIIGSRRKPSFGIAKLRLQGTVLEFNSTDLQFSKEESSKLFKNSLGKQSLSSSFLALLLEKTAGWPAAVALASIALTHQTAASGNILNQLSVTMQPVEEYLSEVVLDNQPNEIYEFLVSTSVLHHLEPEVCRELVPDLNCEYMLERLIAGNLFVSPVPGQIEMWRYHPVFADILRLRLLKNRPNEFLRLHLSASAWYESQGQIVPAIDHALAGGDYPHAARLLEASAMRLLVDGRLRLLARWFAALPIAMLRQYPALIPARLWSTTFTQGAAEAAGQLEAIADYWPRERDEEKIQYSALRCTWLFMQDKPVEAGAIGMQVLSKMPTSQVYADNVLSISMAIFLVQDGMRDDANRLLSSVRQRQGNAAFMRMFIESAESEQNLQDGLLQQATARLRIAVGATHSATPAFDNTNGNAWAGVLYAVTCYEAGQLEQAKRLLRVYAPVVQTMGSPDHLTLALVCLSRIARLQGDADDAADYLAELEHAGMTRGLLRLVASAWLERSREHVLAGNAQAATEALIRADVPEVWNQDRQLRRLAHSALDPRICHLRWVLYFGDSRSALNEIDAELSWTRSFRWPLRSLTLELMRAVALSRCAQESAALDQLQSTLRFTSEQGIVSRVTDEGPLVLSLVNKLFVRERNRGTASAFVQYLSRLQGSSQTLSPQLGALPPPQTPVNTLLAPLTQKEQKVLELLAEGYSNSSLSKELGVSQSTVRTHLRNINSKMDVSSRMQAVARARQLGLLK